MPDAAARAADVPRGRPAPWMVFRLMETLGICPLAAVVKVGDTVADVEDGLNAGVWTVGATWTGNLIGLTQAELGALDRRDLERRIQAAEQTLLEAGAHYVTESFPTCLRSSETSRNSYGTVPWATPEDTTAPDAAKTHATAKPPTPNSPKGIRTPVAGLKTRCPRPA